MIIRFPQSPITDSNGYISLEWQQWLLALQNLTVTIANGNGASVGVSGSQGAPGVDGADGQDGWSIPGAPGVDGAIGPIGLQGVDGEDGYLGPPGVAGSPGASIIGPPGLDGEIGMDSMMPAPQGAQGVDGLMGMPGWNGEDGQDGWSIPGAAGASAGATDPVTGSYSPGSFTVATEKYAVIARHLKLTGTQRATLAGTATLRLT